jgi:signal transduction histidine kinase/BarA-like signal transduction histidine kinase
MNNPENQAAEEKFNMHDIKETTKRMKQLSYIAISVCSVITIIQLFHQNYVSAGLTFAKILFSFLVLLFLHFGYYKFAKYFIVVQINVFLISVSFLVGHKAGGYLYFFPLVFALPMIVNNHKKQSSEIFIFLAITAVCFYISIFWGRETSAIELITDAAYNNLFHVNCAFAVFISGLFAYASVAFERRYVLALTAEKEKVEEAMQARTRFLSTMGHELRTPLNGIIGVSGLLQKDAMLPEQREYFDVLKYCSDHMLSLVNDILDFNKIEAGKFELHPINVNLKEFLISSALPFYNRFEEKSIDLMVDVDDKLNVNIMADDMRLIQVINNLLSNALKFTVKGKVILRASCFGNENGKITARFEVQDTGIGMLKEDAAKIFGGFWQIYHESSRKYAGTGLGLTITQRLLNLMGTELEVNSEFGVGTTFYFTVTFPQVEPAAPKAVEKDLVADLSHYRILIADDNPINMLVAKKILLDWKVSLTTCKNGREVLDALARDHHYNIVLLDLEMPEVDGYTAAAQIKELYPDIPMLAFTAAMVDNDLLDQLMAIGFSDCILKPFQPKALYTKIMQFVK